MSVSCIVAGPAGHILYGDPIIRSECTYRYRSCEPADLWIRSDCYAVRSDPTASISLTFSTAAVHAATALAPSQDGLGQWPHSLQYWRHQACHTARSPALSRRCCRSAANLPSRARHRCHFCSPTCRIGTAAAGWPRRRPRCDCPATGSVPTLPPCTQ